MLRAWAIPFVASVFAAPVFVASVFVASVFVASGFVAPAFVLAGCDGSADGSPAGASTSAAAANAGGRQAAGNDPRILSVLDQALACPWIDGSFEYTCKGLTSWKDSKLVKDGNADKTLLNLLEDHDHKVRSLTALALQRSGKRYRTDPQLARRVLAAAQKERSEAVAGDLGLAVGKIDLALTGLEEQAEELLLRHPLALLRRQLASNVLIINHRLFEFMIEHAPAEPDKEVRRAMVSSLWVGTPYDKTAETCSFWLRTAGADTDAEIAGEAAYSCAAWSRGCTGQWDELLDAIEAKALEGGVQSNRMATAIEKLYQHREATEKHRARALAVAKAVVENEGNLAFARATALSFIVQNDPAAKSFAARFSDDEQALVRNAAQRAQLITP